MDKRQTAKELMSFLEDLQNLSHRSKLLSKSVEAHIEEDDAIGAGGTYTLQDTLKSVSIKLSSLAEDLEPLSEKFAESDSKTAHRLALRYLST